MIRRPPRSTLTHSFPTRRSSDLSAPANAEGGGSGHASHTFRRGDRRMGAECRCMADTPVDDGLDTDDESGAPALVTMGLTPDIASPLEAVGTADPAPVVKRGPIATVLNEDRKSTV